MLPNDKQKQKQSAQMQSPGNIQLPPHSATSSELEDGSQTQGPAHVHATRYQQARQLSAAEFNQQFSNETSNGTLPIYSQAQLTLEPLSVQEIQRSAIRQHNLIQEAQADAQAQRGKSPALKNPTKARGEKLFRTPEKLTQAQISAFLRTPPFAAESARALSALPVGAVKAIQIATQLAPHVVEATTASEHAARMESARKEMKLQLQSQRAEIEFTHLQEQQQSNSALLLEKEKSAALSAKLATLEQTLLSSSSQPILVSSSSRSQNAQSPPRISSSTNVRVQAAPAPQSISPSKATSEQQMQALAEHDLQLQADYAIVLKKQLALLLPQAMSDILNTSLKPAPAQDASALLRPVPTAPTSSSSLAQASTSAWTKSAQGVARLQAEETARANGKDQIANMSKQRQAAIKEQEALFAQAQLTMDKAQLAIRSLQEPGLLPTTLPTKPKQRTSARALEKELALLTNDKDLLKDLLKHGSRKIESEEASEDDAEELRSEQGRAIALHNLMHPTRQVPKKDALGYAPCAFIKPDNESDSDEQEEEEADEVDDDESPDYVESAQASQERTLSKDEWEQWQSLKRGATPMLTTDLPAILSAIISSTKPSHEGKLQVALNPPAHGEWDDVNHLMKTYMPLYEKYKASCGSKTSESIFSAYSATQKKRLAKLFTKHSEGRVIHSVDIEDLEKLSNEAFIDMLCKEKGYKTSTLTEDALKAIVWKGRFTDKSSWINHETNWEECLAQTSKKGTVDKKRLIVLYRQSIPEPFIQKHLATKRFDSWQECHNHMAEDMLKDSDFFTEWNEDIRTRAPATTPQDKHDKRQGASAGGGVAPPRQDKPHNAAPAGAATPSAPVKVNEGALTYKDKFGKLNVNPNLIIDLDLNPDKLVCSRCGLIHKWLEEFCTSFKNKQDQLIEPKLTFEQVKKATIARWWAGFFAAKDPNNRPHRDSPSVQATASAAADTQKRLAQ